MQDPDYDQRISIKAKPGAAHDMRACVDWIRNEFMQGSNMALALALHRNLVQGSTHILEDWSRWQYESLINTAPDTYLLEFHTTRVEPEPHVHDWGEYQLLLVNAAQGDTEAAVEFCKLLLSGDVPLPYYPACAG